MNILILGASYGSLLSTKLLMAGHNVTLVCREATASLINREGTLVRIKLRDESDHRVISSAGLAGSVNALVPDKVVPENYDLVALAMQEPQYSSGDVRQLMVRVAAAERPCLSIMNMPPRPFLSRIEAIRDTDLDACYDDVSVWQGFKPGLMSLCSPDPQAFRPPEEKANFLHVGLPTNFKAAAFADEKNNVVLRKLESDIDAVKLDGKDVPVKLRVFDSLFVPMAKWSMLLTGNYRCVTADDVQAIRDAVHTDIEVSRQMYEWVDTVAMKLGAEQADLVPFEKYAKAAENLLKPSSVARALAGGSREIERVDKLVQMVAAQLGMQSDAVDNVVRTVDRRLSSQ